MQSTFKPSSIFIQLCICSLLIVSFHSCSNKTSLPLNKVTPNDDEAIGSSIDAAFLYHIDTSTNEYLLSEVDYPAIYHYVHDICSKIQDCTIYTSQSSAESPLRMPTIRIIQSANKTKAFVAPGGYVYIYTDLLKTINYEAEFVPILAHLLSCSINRLDVQKLEEHFSTNFLLDLAIGSNIDANGSSPATNVHAIIEQLADAPYKKTNVDFLDKKAEKITCSLNYDVQFYANLYTQSNITELGWFQLFPRSISNNAYAVYLANQVKGSLNCEGIISVGEYSQFKALLP